MYVKQTYKAFLKVSVSNILACLMSPLIEIVDLMIVGNSGHVACMAGIGIAISILNIFTWFFGNNLSTYTTQAIKQVDEKNGHQIMYYSIIMAGLIGILFILFKASIWSFFIRLFDIEETVKIRGYIYYKIVSWSMPFILINHAVIGWLLGLGKMKPLLLLQGSMNILNLFMNILFVRGFNIDLEAVALSTVIIHMFMAIFCFILIFKDIKAGKAKKATWKFSYMLKFIFEHIDIMIQSICAIVINMEITIASSYLGSDVLAANVILLQIQNLFTYLFNGFSMTIAEFTNAGSKDDDTDLIRFLEESCMTFTMYAVIFFVLLFRICHKFIIECFTNIVSVKETTYLYDGWLTMYIVMASWGLGIQGIFRGRNQDKMITNVNLIGLIIFICLFKRLTVSFGNHGLWLGVIIFQFIRSLLLMAVGGKNS